MTLHLDIYSKFRNRFTVKDFWDQAKAFGGSDRDNWCLFDIVDRLGRLIQGPMSIADYSMAHQELWDDIDYYAHGEQTENADRRVTLRIRLLAYLSGLNPAYANIRRQALHCQEGLPYFNALVQELTEEESHSKLHPSLPALSSALLSRPSSVNAPSSKPKLKLIFSYCGKLEHIKEKCYRHNRDLRLARDASETTDKASSTSMPGPSSVSMEQLQADLARLTSLVSSLQSTSMASFGNFVMS